LIYQTVTNSFKQEILSGIHDLTSDTLKLALYTSGAELGRDTTVYTATGEASGSGYSAGGSVLGTTTISTSGSTVFVDFPDLTFSSVSITAHAALIYNSTQANKSVCVLNFGLSITRSGSDFVIQFPNADLNNAIIRFS